MNISEKDKRTLRLGAIIVVAYLVLFYGLIGVKNLKKRKKDYQQLSLKAERLKVDLLKYETEMVRLEKLKRSFNFNPGGEFKETLVSEVSATIQESANRNGIKLKFINESGARPSSAIRASMRMEGEGSMQGVIRFLDGMGRLGFPLFVESVQLENGGRRPGQLQFNLEALILDYSAFKASGGNDA